jgi:hypothetical protein
MSGPTPGPWRWEINLEHRRVHLVGGTPMFDLTVVDFDRWGMNGATMSLRDTAHDGMNIMHKLHDRPDWFAPIPGRKHHASWLQVVTHPDARLMAAAPTMLAALTAAEEIFDRNGLLACHAGRQQIRDAIAAATGEPT